MPLIFNVVATLCSAAAAADMLDVALSVLDDIAIARAATSSMWYYLVIAWDISASAWNVVAFV